MTHNTLIKNGTLIDGNGGTPITDGAILVKDNKISAVGTASSIKLPNADITTIDAQGGTIMPGMIDTHVHMIMEGGNIMQMAMEPFSHQFYKSVNYMRNTVMAGITTVRDAGGADLGMKTAVEQGTVLGPRMQISISVLSITGGHVDWWLPSGIDLDIFQAHPGRPTGIVDGVDAVRKKVREVLRAGADIIKICSTGGVLSPTDHPEFTQFSPEELAVIVQEAEYRRGVKVMSHAQGLQGIKNAVEAGIHSIEHAIYLDDEVLEMMLERGTYVVPTLLAPVAVLEQAAGGGMPEWGIQKSREVVEIHGESIAKAHKAGVNIAMGTDAGVMPHGTNLRELKLMTDIGMTPMESIVATTKTASECLGWQDKIGTLQAGKLADIIISKADPLQNIAVMADNDNIGFVMLDGEIVKNQTIDNRR